jgi:chromosome segregation ATPase
MPTSREINMRDLMQKTIDKLAEENDCLTAEIGFLEDELDIADDMIGRLEAKITQFEAGYLALLEESEAREHVVELEGKITQLEDGYVALLDDRNEARERVAELEAAIKDATEYGEVSFLGVNIPFSQFTLLQKVRNKND